ncbi:MAG: hypothetical protein ACI97A_002202 [Planctomycetota bacterium]|jgi:hypothetical protein
MPMSDVMIPCRLSVGGMVDNFVRFQHYSGQAPPDMSDDEFIWIEEVADGWYLVKTT